MAMTGEFLLTHRFSVEVTGSFIPSFYDAPSIVGYFTEVSGLEASIEVIEYKVVSVFGELINQKIPGPPTWSDVTLKRGITTDMAFWEWYDLIRYDHVFDARASVTITMYDLNGSSKAQWYLSKAWPSKVTGPELSASSNDVGIEELTLVHKGIKRITP